MVMQLMGPKGMLHNGIRLRATQQVGAGMNSVILCMQNTQDGHSKARGTGGRDVDGRAHRA